VNGWGPDPDRRGPLPSRAFTVAVVALLVVAAVAWAVGR
jgi:hypothetical protein